MKDAFSVFDNEKKKNTFNLEDNLAEILEESCKIASIKIIYYDLNRNLRSQIYDPNQNLNLREKHKVLFRLILKERQPLLGKISFHNDVKIVERVFEAFLMSIGKINQLKD